MIGYPREQFRYRLEIGGLTVGEFSEVNGEDTDIEPMGYREGYPDGGAALKLAGTGRYGRIRLEKGFMEPRVLKDWIEGEAGGTREQKMIFISMQDNQQSVAAWKVINAWPVGYTASDLNVDSDRIAVESLELVHEGMIRMS